MPSNPTDFELPRRDGPRPLPKKDELEPESVPLAPRVSFEDKVFQRPPVVLADILLPRPELPLTRNPALSDFERLSEMYFRNYIDGRTFLEASEQIPWQKPMIGGRPTTYSVTKGLRVLESIQTAKARESIRLKTNLAAVVGHERSTLNSWLEYGDDEDADPIVRAFSLVFRREAAQLTDDYFDATLNAKVTDAKTAGKLMAGMYPNDASEQSINKGVVINNTTVNVHKEMLDVITGGKDIMDVTPSHREPDRVFPLLPSGANQDSEL